jgi:hypothetical protein
MTMSRWCPGQQQPVSLGGASVSVYNRVPTNQGSWLLLLLLLLLRIAQTMHTVSSVRG